MTFDKLLALSRGNAPFPVAGWLLDVYLKTLRKVHRVRGHVSKRRLNSRNYPDNYAYSEQD